MKRAALLISLVLVLAACNTSHTFSGVVSDPPSVAGDFTLTDQTNQPFALSEFKGQWILMAYGYTHCPDVCPMTLSILRDVKKSIGAAADQLGVVLVTVDPERDTAEIMGKYVAHFDQTFKGLTGSLDAVATAAQLYGVKYEKKASTPAVGYVMNHTAYVYLIDPQFRLRVTFPFGVKAEEITSDLKYLMQAEKK